jgi:hypothetical protein
MVDKKLVAAMNGSVCLLKQSGENNPCLGPAPQFPWRDIAPLWIYAPKC